MIDKVRAKFTVQSVTRTNMPVARTAENPEGKGENYNIDLMAVYGGDNASDENKSFWQYTPSGNIKMNAIKQNVGEFFEVGQEYYVDFTKAVKPTE